jgi:tetratricopeptide (TPR) repeat protein
LLVNTLGREPRNLIIRRMLAGCLSREGRTAEAREQYERILDIAPGDAEAMQYLRARPAPAPAPQPAPARTAPPTERQAAGSDFDRAERLIKAGQLPEAEQLLAGIVAARPDLALPQQRLAEVYSTTKQFVQAAEIYERLAERAGASVEFRLYAAQNYAWASDYPNSIRNYRFYLQERADDTEALLNLSNILLWSNELDEAVTAYRAYLAKKPEDFDTRLSLANALLWSSHYEEAVAEISKVREVRPRDASVQIAIARAYDQWGRYDQAVLEYDTAIAFRPDDAELVKARARAQIESIMGQSAALVEKKNFEGAIRILQQTLDANPDSKELQLQLARVYSWGGRMREAANEYERYLSSNPADEDATREAARVYLSTPDFGRAREHFQRLTQVRSPKAEDIEGLINAWMWDGKPEGAQVAAQRLLELDPNNETALDAVRSFRDHQRENSLAEARRYVQLQQYEQALSAFREFSRAYGADRETELSIARLYGWSRQYDQALIAFQEYLQRYPSDLEARVELGDIHRFLNQHSAALNEYATVLLVDPQQPGAILGRAEALDQRGDDRKQVARAYAQALAAAPSSVHARERIEDISFQIAPAISYNQYTFTDSDGFGRTSSTLEGTIPVGGGLTVTPQYLFGYFNQYRNFDGTVCGAATSTTDRRLLKLTSSICAAKGDVNGNGPGVRIDYNPTRQVTLALRVNRYAFSNSRSSINAGGDLYVRLGPEKVLGISYARRDAAFDVNTVSTLFAGILEDLYLISYSQPITARWTMALNGGFARFDRGKDQVFEANTQRRVAARFNYAIRPGVQAGYFVRLTDFAQYTPLYFSPSFYGVAGFTYSYTKDLGRIASLALNADLGAGRVNQFRTGSISTVEALVGPSLTWRISSNLELNLGYTFGRSRSSVFGSPGYRTGGFTFGLRGAFTPRYQAVTPGRFTIQ